MLHVISELVSYFHSLSSSPLYMESIDYYSYIETDEGLAKESEPLWCKIMWSIGRNVFHYETKVLVVSHPSTNNLQHMLFTFQHLQITDTRWGKETWTQYIIYKQLTLDTFVRLSINCVDRSRTRPANIRVEKQHRWLNSTKIII